MKFSRRHFIRSALGLSAVTAVGTPAYAAVETRNLQIDRVTIQVPKLPEAFRGTTIAFLTDIHYGPYVSESYVRDVVRTAAGLNADMVIYGGDYVSKSVRYVEPCFNILKSLRAPLGVFGVFGNHDYHDGIVSTRKGMLAADIVPLANQGVWVERGNTRIRIVGVEDKWMGKPEATPALGDAQADDCCILVSHNPDFSEDFIDYRVRLVLSGHTHGGQIVIPGIEPTVPSNFGTKYIRGLVAGPRMQVYVSAGIGVTVLPFRFNCPPEIGFLTLV